MIVIVVMGAVAVTFCICLFVYISDSKYDRLYNNCKLDGLYTSCEYEHIRMQRELEYQSLLMQCQDTRDRYLSVHEEHLPTNCKNCGAPLESHRCEYCGTKY